MKVFDKGDILIKNLNSDNLKEELKTKDRKKLKDACKEFEAYFLNLILEEMRKSLPKDSLFPETNEKKIFDYMYYSALTREAVKNQSIGIADMLYNYLKKFI